MHTLTLKADVSGPVVVVTAIGELDLHTQDLFEQAVTEQLAYGPVVVDLAQVEFLSISALRSLMVCSAMAPPRGLVYAEPSRQARRLLAISGVGDQLCVRDSVGGPPRETAPLAG